MMLERHIETILCRPLMIRLGNFFGLHSWTTEVLSGKVEVEHYRSRLQSKECLNIVRVSWAKRINCPQKFSGLKLQHFISCSYNMCSWEFRSVGLLSSKLSSRGLGSFYLGSSAIFWGPVVFWIQLLQAIKEYERDTLVFPKMSSQESAQIISSDLYIVMMLH